MQSANEKKEINNHNSCKAHKPQQVTRMSRYIQRFKWHLYLRGNQNSFNWTQGKLTRKKFMPSTGT